MIPEELTEEYQGDKFAEERYIYFEINKGMYVLPQAGSLENKILQKILAAYGFSTTPTTLGLWRHEKIPIQFDLVVDEFGVKYEQKEDVQ